MRTSSLLFSGCLAFLVGCGGGTGKPVGTGGSGGGASGAGGAGGGSIGACGVGDVEPNDTRDKATPYTAGASVVGCVATVDDIDMYQFTAPTTDPAGGYFTIAFDNVGAGYVDATVYAASDDGEIFNAYAADRGGSVHLYFAAAPGQQFRIAVAEFSGFTDPFNYTMTATYTKIPDAFEPNDTRATAKPITVGTPVMGYVFSGYRSGTLSSDDSFDFYGVTLPAGATTVKMTDPPNNVLGELTLFDSAGAEIANEYSNTKGANVTIAGQVVTAGQYFIRASIFSAAPESRGDGIMLPDHFTHPYVLTVQQP